MSITFNSREIIIPFFRVGEPDPKLSEIWEALAKKKGRKQ